MYIYACIHYIYTYIHYICYIFFLRVNKLVCVRNLTQYLLQNKVSINSSYYDIFIIYHIYKHAFGNSSQNYFKISPFDESCFHLNIGFL